MSSFTFEFGTQDAFGCTIIDKHTFTDELGLKYNAPLTIKRVSGSLYRVNVLKCTTRGYRHYQIDISDLGIPVGSTVTFRPIDEIENGVFMTVVDTPERMWKNPRHLVDAIVELQYSVKELKDFSDWEEDTDHAELTDDH